MDFEYTPMDKEIEEEIIPNPDESSTDQQPKSPKTLFMNFMHIGNIFQSFIGSSILTLPFYNMQVVLEDRPIAGIAWLSRHRFVGLRVSAPAAKNRPQNQIQRV
jgi:hypothetical protein